MNEGADNGDKRAQLKINPVKTVNDSLLSDIFPAEEGEVGIKHVLLTTNSKKRKLSNAKAKRQEENNKATPSDLKPRRKRRILSCDECRKLKTKCVYDDASSSCARCKRLQMECSLLYRGLGSENTMQSENIRETEVLPGGIKLKNIHVQNNDPYANGKFPFTVYNDLQGQLFNIVNSIETLNEKLNSMMEMQQNNAVQNMHFQQQLEKLQLKPEQEGNQKRRPPSHDGSYISNTEASTPTISNFVDLAAKIPLREDLTAPLNLIDKIQATLLQNPSGNAAKSDFVQATEKFVEFYLKNELLCLQLSKEFLEISHFYIIPGGISGIDRDYVLEHPFISCVFVLIAMMVSKEYKNTEMQKEVHYLLKNIVASINEKDPLSDHDIESILYVCMYAIGDYNKWILSASGLMHYFESIDTRGIIERVVNDNVYLDDDLFHLRILNALSACHLQTAIGMGRSIMIDDTWWKVHRLTVIFPNATVGDAIQVAQLDLFKMLVRNLKNVDYFYKFKYFDAMNSGEYIFTPSDLKDWRKKWDRIISKDVSKISSYSYYFAYILLARKFIDLFSNSNKDRLAIAFNTASHYSFELLKNFLDSKADFIKGIPSFQLNQVVYACFTLFEYLGFMIVDERKRTLSIISKTYWHLNMMGQELNDATGMIAQIVKKLVEMANKNQVLNITTIPDKGFIGTGSITRTSMYKNRKNSQQQKKLSREDLPMFMGNDISTHSSPQSLVNVENSPQVRKRITIEDIPMGVRALNDSHSALVDHKSDQYQLRIKSWPTAQTSKIRTTGLDYGTNTSTKNNNPGFNTADKNSNNDGNNNNYELPGFMDMLANGSENMGNIENIGTSHFQMPDLSNFNNFDEFFKDLFSDFAS